MNRQFQLVAFFLLFVLFSSCNRSFLSSESFLDSRKGLKYQEISVDTAFQQAFLVWVEQPIDHNHPSQGTFWQRVWLSHSHVSAPTVVVTEGYWASRNYVTELAHILNANQIIIEHRYFDRSVPDSIQWEYLTIEQAAKDHHRVIQLFEKFYTGKWVSTGVSKGGQTAMIHRAYFPDDVDATVTYVAPFNLSREDSRLLTFFDQVGTPEMRNKIRNFQIEILKRKPEVLPLFEKKVEELDLAFSLGLEKTLELCVLEYPFSLLQWCGPIEEIPEPSASATELFKHLSQYVDLTYFSDKDRMNFAPFFYQAYSELGYYSYLSAPFIPYMSSIKADTLSSDFMLPFDVKPTFENRRPYEIMDQLIKKDPKMIHIVGAKDPWSSTSPDVGLVKNSYKFSDPNGCHLTRIGTLPDSLKYQVLKLLNVWILRN
jgi:hypothetical protein